MPETRLQLVGQLQSADGRSQNVRFTGTEITQPTIQTVASAATIILPQEDVVNISGTTTITSIDAEGHAGKIRTLIFSDVVTVTDGSNLNIGGNFTSSADDTITLCCDGTDWFEIARRVN